MDRDSILYKARRKAQIVAQYILPDKVLAKLYSYIVLKKSVNLSKPETFNEKIQWLKLYDYPFNELVIKCADKYRVREYVSEKGLESILVPLLGHWYSSNEIDWEKLPNSFVLKCNHGCAYNIICDDKQKLDVNRACKQLDKWLKEDFGVFNIELHYSKIKPRIITAEKFLGNAIIDYKFFCFNGEPKYMYVSSDLVHDRDAQIGFFYLNGDKMPLIREDYSPMDIESLPDFFDDMLSCAKILCEDFDFVRVDFFVTETDFYFAELTFTPSAGMMPFNPDEYDYYWGKDLKVGALK